MIHYSFTKKMCVFKGWSFPHFSNSGIKINIQKMIFLFLFLGNFSMVPTLIHTTVFKRTPYMLKCFQIFTLQGK